MDWFDDLGAYYLAMPQAPALALDMALNGPPAPQAGLHLAKSALATEAEIDLYPQEQFPVSPEV